MKTKTNLIFLSFALLFLMFSFSVKYSFAKIPPGGFYCNRPGDCEPNEQLGSEATCCREGEIDWPNPGWEGSHMCASTGGGPYCYGQPTYPTYPTYPDYPSYPSYNTYNTYPSYNTYNSYNTYPDYPSYNTYNTYPSYNTYNSYNTYPTYNTYDAFPPPLSLTVTRVRGGTLRSTDNFINCGLTCSKNDYVKGTNVTLKAIPASSYWKFSGWSGDCSGTGNCVLNMTTSKKVKGGFVPRAFIYKEF